MKRVSGLLAILVLACSIALQLPSSIRYTIGTANEHHLTYGFWSTESNAEGRYQWSDGDGRLRFFGYGTAKDLMVAVRLIGPYGSRGEDTTLRLRVGETTLLETASPQSWRTYWLLVPNAGSGWQTPEIQVEGTLTSKMAGDGREVGVAISMVEARPIHGQGMRAVIEYSAFLGLLLALIWFSLSLLIRPLWALGITLVGGATLFIGIRLAPAEMAYWLPPLWGSVLLPAGAIAMLWLSERLAPHVQNRAIGLATGLGLGLVGGFILRITGWSVLGGILLLIGTGITSASLIRATPQPTPSTTPTSGRTYRLILLASLILACTLRLFNLDSIPFGIWRDEARHGLIAMQILADPNYRPIYVPTADIPALLFYLQSLSIAALGPTVSAVRIVPALAGALTTLVIGYTASQLWGRSAGLAAALMLAASAWHIWLSRLAFAAVLDPLLSLIALALLWRICTNQGSPQRQIIEGMLGGSALGLALYTYHPARLMPLAALLWIGLQLGRDWSAWRRAQRPLAIFIIAGVIITSPLIVYWLSQSGDFNQRVGQVSLLDRENAEWSLSVDLDQNLTRYALMWHVAGEENARHNIPGVPMLDPLSGLLFLIGLLLLLNDLSKGHGSSSLPLLMLLGVGLVPGLLSNNAPHAVRSVDAIAPAILIAAYSIKRIAPHLSPVTRPLRISLITTSAALIIGINSWGYFGRVPYDPQVWDAFTYTTETAIGQAIHANTCQGSAFVPEKYLHTEVLSYLAVGHDVIPFTVANLPPSIPTGACVFVPATMDTAEQTQIETLMAGRATAEVIQYYPGSTQPVFWVYR